VRAILKCLIWRAEITLQSLEISATQKFTEMIMMSGLASLVLWTLLVAGNDHLIEYRQLNPNARNPKKPTHPARQVFGSSNVVRWNKAAFSNRRIMTRMLGGSEYRVTGHTLGSRFCKARNNPVFTRISANHVFAPQRQIAPVTSLQFNSARISTYATGQSLLHGPLQNQLRCQVRKLLNRQAPIACLCALVLRQRRF
jgi:hypothetical protein